MQRQPSIFVSRARRRGFTLIELMLGLLVTSLVMAALAVLMAAVAQGWKQSAAAQSSANLSAQTHLRLQRTLKNTRLVGALRAGSLDGSSGTNAALMIWKSDANSDWKIQFSEMAVLEYHSASDTTDPSTIRLYQVIWPAGWSTSQKQAADFTLGNNDEIYQNSEIDTFKAMSNVGYTVLARNVSGCMFHKNDVYTTPRPSIDYKMTIVNGSTSETELGTVSLRTPATLPVSQR